MKITLVAGTRPNFIKIAPIIEAIEKSNNKHNVFINYRLVHTGQHYDEKMSNTFFKQLNIPNPNVNLACGGGSHAIQTANIMIEFEKELKENPSDLVLVVGDVNSTMACAIVAKKMLIKVAHVEAGIRSDDVEMPEEINRLVTDSITDYFFTTSKYANANLKKAGVKSNQIFFVGNTMIDTLKKNEKRFLMPSFFKDLSLIKKEYFVLTLHRPNNVDNDNKLREILSNLDSYVQFPILFPIHPRTKSKLENLNLVFKNIILVEPMSYLEFNYVVKNSKAVITDSGGITEEATVMNIPCVTLRNSTERPETAIIGTNKLVGDDFMLLRNSIKLIEKNNWKEGKTPYLWDGKASKRIVIKLLELFNEK